LVPFDPKRHGPLIDKIKDGRFHHSAAALSLYCTAYSPRAVHSHEEAPFGYFYRTRGGKMAGIGVYQRFDGGFYGCIIPLNASPDSIADLAKRLISRLGLDGVYVRFLKADTFMRLLGRKGGFKPAKEEPWHPDSPEEDETLSSSVIRAASLIHPDFRFKNRTLRHNVNRALAFLKRNRMAYSIEPLQGRVREAGMLIYRHFEQMKLTGKVATSTAYDYKGLISHEILELDSVSAYLGVLRRKGHPDFPVSVFICDDVGQKTVAIYAGITLRDRKSLFEIMKIRNTSGARKGFSAFSPFTYAIMFRNLSQKGAEFIDLGGSEHSGLNQWKRDMGAEVQPTYWAFMAA
jgi:hypothetical protein